MRVAAVDVGTNTTRLLIADWDGRRLTRVLVRTHVTRLGRGVDATKSLSEEGIRATLERLSEYKDLIEAEGVARTVVVATSAARDAKNSQELLDGAQALGMPLRIISGREEAEVSFRGATADLDSRERLVIDVGGGSTELIRGSGESIGSAISLDLGCVRLTERFLTTDPPTRRELDAIAGRAGSLVGAILPELVPIPEAAIAVGGTATTLGAIFLGLDAYDAETVDLTPLSREVLGELRDRLAAMTVAEIAKIPVVQPGRADVLVAGAELLVALADVLGLGALVVRDSDMLDGLAMEAARPQALRDGAGR
jgi:exopolyphosphatase / guanosine-5'-triphosphate,3'-diphosphate pyrophosphatase